MFQPLDERIEEELGHGHVSDVCFGAGPGESELLFSSRAALALASPVFHAMFFAPHWHSEVPGAPDAPAAGPAPGSPGVREGSKGFSAERHCFVAVTDVEPSALRCMLRYVHHLDPRLTLDNALHVYRAADKYQMDGLLEACSTFLDEHVDPRDVDQVLRLFDVACRLGLERHAHSFLAKLGELSRLQTWRLFSADEFWALHGVSMASLLASDGLCVDEEPLWCALQRWAELRAAASAPERSPELAGATQPCGETTTAWQDHLRPLKRLIRFPTMRAAFFARKVAQTGVLNPTEVVEVFCHLARGADASARQTPSSERPEVLVADAFRTEPRAPQLGWAAAPGGAADAFLAEECGLGPEAAAPAHAAVLDGRALAIAPWGSRVILGGSGTGFHFAFGSLGFATGRHAWTISWQPLEAGLRSRGGRGGAAGLAREGDGFGGVMAAAAAAAAGGGASPAGGAARASTSNFNTAGPSGGRVAALSATGAAATGLGGTSADEPSARFVDWPTCIVFGVKRDVSEKRYVAWDTVAEGEAVEAVVRFAIAVDFVSKVVTYIADRGERSWTAPLVQEGLVYPVVAASGPHSFQIQYGLHL